MYDFLYSNTDVYIISSKARTLQILPSVIVRIHVDLWIKFAAVQTCHFKQREPPSSTKGCRADDESTGAGEELADVGEETLERFCVQVHQSEEDDEAIKDVVLHPLYSNRKRGSN